MTSIDYGDSLSIELLPTFVTDILRKLNDRFLPLTDRTRSMTMRSSLILKFRISKIND
jgi:hypothetical protein